jgi:hypothetical protein
LVVGKIYIRGIFIVSKFGKGQEFSVGFLGGIRLLKLDRNVLEFKEFDSLKAMTMKLYKTIQLMI